MVYPATTLPLKKGSRVEGSKSEADFAMEEEVSLQGVFVHGLAENIKDELAIQDKTEALIQLAMRLDNHIRKR